MKNRRGVSLVEVLVAISILSVVLVGLGGIMFRVGRSTIRANMGTHHTAAVQLAAGWIGTIPYDSLGAAVGCESLSVSTLSYTRCVEIDTISSRQIKASVIVQPSSTMLTVDTVVIYRNQQYQQAPF